MDRRSTSAVSSPSSQRSPNANLIRSSSLSSSHRQFQNHTEHRTRPQSLLVKQQRLRTPSSKTASPPPVAGAGRFTEEWDASQRGSSIIDDSYRSNFAAMQRSNSVHSFNAGDDQQLPVRGNTLRKKSSMRRTSSLGRSSSRRSNKAGSVRSLALHSASDPDDAHSAFYCPVPTSGTPTDVLANRFQSAWHAAPIDFPSDPSCHLPP
jgi:hypothetical protein